MANLARTLLVSRNDLARARELCLQAAKLAPHDDEVTEITREVLSLDVGSWYFSMVRDARRHALYERALRAVLAGGGEVLDIGAGTGLFAMMAVRAGASRVTACEARLSVAEAARAVVAQNGLSDRVNIVAKPSTEVVVGADLGEPADLLLWDNLANNMIGVGALPALEDAKRRLTKPGARVMPARVEILAALAQDLQQDRRQMGLVEGFDLSAFNALAKPIYTVNCRCGHVELRSDPVVVFAVDLQVESAFPAARTRVEATSKGGEVNGIVQWLRFHLDETTVYETAPGMDVHAFGLEMHSLPEPISTRPGETFAIGASHDRQHLRLWLQASGQEAAE